MAELALEPPFRAVTPLAASGDKIYGFLGDNALDQGTAVVEMTVRSGTGRVVARSAEGLAGLVADGNGAYWGHLVVSPLFASNYDAIETLRSDGTVAEVAASPGHRRVYGTMQLDESHIYWLTDGTARDGGNVTVWRAPRRGGGKAQEVYTSCSEPGGLGARCIEAIAVVGDGILIGERYVTGRTVPSKARVRWISKQGGGAVRDLMKTEGEIESIAADDRAVFVGESNGGKGRVLRIDRSTGAVSVLRDNVRSRSVKLDGNHVFAVALDSSGAQSVIAIPTRGGPEVTVGTAPGTIRHLLPRRDELLLGVAQMDAAGAGVHTRIYRLPLAL